MVSKCLYDLRKVNVEFIRICLHRSFRDPVLNKPTVLFCRSTRVGVHRRTPSEMQAQQSRCTFVGSGLLEEHHAWELVVQREWCLILRSTGMVAAVESVLGK